MLNKLNVMGGSISIYTTLGTNHKSCYEGFHMPID